MAILFSAFLKCKFIFVSLKLLLPSYRDTNIIFVLLEDISHGFRPMLQLTANSSIHRNIHFLILKVVVSENRTNYEQMEYSWTTFNCFMLIHELT